MSLIYNHEATNLDIHEKYLGEVSQLHEQVTLKLFKSTKTRDS